MKPIFCLLLALSSAMHAAEPAADEGQVLTAKLTDVTVYADRAQVVRQAPAQLASGTTRFVFARLPGWIDEGSVRVTLAPADAGKILDVQVRRTFLTKPTDEEFTRAEAAVRQAADEMAALDDEKAVLEAQAKQVEAIRVFSLDKFPKDAAAREVKPQEYAAAVKFVADSLREVGVARRDLEKKRRDLQPELQARQRRGEELRQRAQLEQRSVIVTVQGQGARAATLALSCMLPGATWEPVHELRAQDGATNLSLTSFAVVSQSTGEDWTGVALSLSTQRSTDTLRIPELKALLLGGGRSIARVVGARGDTFKDAAQSWTMNNLVQFDIANPTSPGKRAEYRDNQALLLGNTANVVEVFAQLMQRGTSAHFAAEQAQTVRADGRSVRVPIGHVDLAAKHSIVAAPELSLNAARTADLTHSGRQPLLPGKVGLYIDGAFLGLTETDFVASGETFDVFLGVADQIKLSRTVDPKRSEYYRSGTRSRMKVSFLLTSENLSAQPVILQLTDRVPVSEVEEIRVTSVKVTPELKPDIKGILRWTVALAPKQSREHRIEYTLEYPADVLTRADAERKAAAEAPAKARLHFAPASPATESDLRLQIQSLEKTLRK